MTAKRSLEVCVFNLDRKEADIAHIGVGFCFGEGLETIQADEDIPDVIRYFPLREISAASKLDDNMPVKTGSEVEVSGVFMQLLPNLPLAVAPGVILSLVAPPGLPVLFKFAHVALVDRALLCFTAGAAVVLLVRDAVMIEQVGQGVSSLLQQVSATLAPQGDTADKAIRRDVADIPGGRRFRVRDFGFCYSFCGHLNSPYGWNQKKASP